MTNLKKFSIVVPSRESDFILIKKNLLSYLTVGAEEFLLCVDDDSSEEFIDNVNNLYEKLKKKHTDISSLRIIRVERRPDFQFHQAWVRRKGFLSAKNDYILTGDIDLFINKKVVKAIETVGQNNIGLASLQKFPFQSNLRFSFITIWRMMYQTLIRATYRDVFTGLYALYRPYWLDTEDEKIKNLKNAKYAGLKGSMLGEDTYLRDCMEKKHKCAYLRYVGAVDLGIALHDNPRMQIALGRYYFQQGKSLYHAFLAGFLYAHPEAIVGYLYEKERVKKGLSKMGDVT